MQADAGGLCRGNEVVKDTEQSIIPANHLGQMMSPIHLCFFHLIPKAGVFNLFFSLSLLLSANLPQGTVLKTFFFN